MRKYLFILPLPETALGKQRLWEEDSTIHKMSLLRLIKKLGLLETVALLKSKFNFYDVEKHLFGILHTAV